MSLLTLASNCAVFECTLLHGHSCTGTTLGPWHPDTIAHNLPVSCGRWGSAGGCAWRQRQRAAHRKRVGGGGAAASQRAQAGGQQQPHSQAAQAAGTGQRRGRPPRHPRPGLPPTSKRRHLTAPGAVLVRAGQHDVALLPRRLGPSVRGARHEQLSCPTQLLACDACRRSRCLTASQMVTARTAQPRRLCGRLAQQQFPRRAPLTCFLPRCTSRSCDAWYLGSLFPFQQL